MSDGAYARVFQILKLYWKSYGGAVALIKSPYLHAALIANALMYNSWANPGWWESATSVLASLIGFTLGGYAILIAFGDEEFKSLLTGTANGARESPFIIISATFVHFIMVQITALLFALVAASRPIDAIAPLLAAIPGVAAGWRCVGAARYLEMAVMYGGWFIGPGLFLYAIFLAISATLGIFRVSTWYDRAKTQVSS